MTTSMVRLFQGCLPIVTPLAQARLGGGCLFYHSIIFRQKLSKDGIKFIGYAFRLKNYVKIPPPHFSDFSELVPPLRDSCFLIPFSGYSITICRYLFILHRNVFRDFRWNGRPFSSYCRGNVNDILWGSAMYPC